jgi:hypothetical protein
MTKTQLFWKTFDKIKSEGFSGKAAYQIARQQLQFTPPISSKLKQPKTPERIEYKAPFESKQERIDRVLAEAREKTAMEMKAQDTL